MRISGWSSDVGSSDLERAVCTGQIVLRGIEPGGVLRIGDDADRDRHEGVILTAKLGALTIINAFLLVLEPGLVQARSEERRVGKEGVGSVRSRWSAYQ